MPRPTSKDALLDAATTQFDKLVGLVHSMSEPERHSVFDFSADARKREAHWRRDTCLRDVLVHLYEWHQLMLSWVAANRAGESRPFLPPPYTWRSYGQLNEQLCRKHRSTPLADAQRLLRGSHDAVLRAIEEFSDRQLFEKGQFPWTGTSTLGSYFVSVTSSHYAWAITKLRAHLTISRSTR